GVLAEELLEGRAVASAAEKFLHQIDEIARARAGVEEDLVRKRIGGKCRNAGVGGIGEELADRLELLTAQRFDCFLLKLLQRRLVPDLLPHLALADRFDRLAHAKQRAEILGIRRRLGKRRLRGVGWIGRPKRAWQNPDAGYQDDQSNG